ncbi:hypothetical protein JCM8097_000429 [Rhodosporidiobolus ruineniae]
MLLPLLLLATASTAVFSLPTSLLTRQTTSSTSPFGDSTWGPPPVIDLSYARYQGYTNNTVWTWKGLQYASAPRFQPPSPPFSSRRDAVRNATNYRPACHPATIGSRSFNGTVNLEASSAPPDVPYAEECLFLNVWAPAGTKKGDDLPVLVFIHGGGYANGNARQQTDLDDLIRFSGNRLVGISIQYRLGAFGFLPGRASRSFGTLNAGLQDQEAALQWVQAHVHRFGGSKDKVTVWGTSAGAGSVVNHLISYGGHGAAPFRGAIASSVFIPQQLSYSHAESEKVYEEVVKAAGCGFGNSTFSAGRGEEGFADEYGCLQAVSADVLAGAARTVSEGRPTGYWTFVPVLDGEGGMLRERASVALSQGRVRKRVEGQGVKVIALNNEDEGLIFEDPTLLTDSTASPSTLSSQFDALLAGLYPLLTASERSTVASLYPSTAFNSTGNSVTRLGAVIGDATFICPDYWLAAAVSQSSTAWKGAFAQGSSYHQQDLPYFVGNVWAGDKSVASVQSFTGALVGFILAGDPNANPTNTSVNPYWPAFRSEEEEGRVMVFNTTSADPLSQADPRVVRLGEVRNLAGQGQREVCEFWRGSISKNAGL